MKNFSLFNCALTSTAIQTESLDRIASISRCNFEGRESFICRTSEASIEYACLMIENSLLLRTNRGGRVYAGVEKLSTLQPIIDRYLRIADVSETVYLFGANDWRPPRHPNIRLITLEEDFQLAREVFLIALSSTFNIAFIASHDPILDQPTFLALKTSDTSFVHRLTNAVEGVINWSLAA